MIASTTVSATHIIASTTASTSDIANVLVTLKIENKDIFSAITALLTTCIGAFLGAGSAFLLQNWANKRKEIKERVAVGNKTLFIIFRQWNELSLIQKTLIEPIREHPHKSIALQPTLPLNYEELKYDFNNLSFLLETKHVNCMSNLYLAEAKFKKTIQIINERSSLHTGTIQPLWEKAGAPKTGSTEDLENIFGVRILSILESLTLDEIEYIDETIPFLEKIRDELVSALKELYPKEKINSFKAIENKEPPTHSP